MRSTIRTIVEKNDKQGRLRWFCDDCDAQVHGVSLLAKRCVCGHPKQDHAYSGAELPGQCFYIDRAYDTGCHCERFKAPTTHVIYGPCSCEGWTNTDNPMLAMQITNLMYEGLEVNP